MEEDEVYNADGVYVVGRLLTSVDGWRSEEHAQIGFYGQEGVWKYPICLH